MIAIAFKPGEIGPISSLVFSVFIIGFFVFMVLYFAWQIFCGIKSFQAKRAKKEVIKLYLESHENGSVVLKWLKDHKEEMVKNWQKTLNDPELLDLLKKDQELFDRICKIDHRWKDEVVPPMEMHKYFIELCQGQHKQTH